MNTQVENEHKQSDEYRKQINKYEQRIYYAKKAIDECITQANNDKKINQSILDVAHKIVKDSYEQILLLRIDNIDSFNLSASALIDFKH